MSPWLVCMVRSECWRLHSNKIANDIRPMGSGPRAGLGELRLLANEPQFDHAWQG